MIFAIICHKDTSLYLYCNKNSIAQIAVLTSFKVHNFSFVIDHEFTFFCIKL